MIENSKFHPQDNEHQKPIKLQSPKAVTNVFVEMANKSPAEKPLQLIKRMNEIYKHRKVSRGNQSTP